MKRISAAWPQAGPAAGATARRVHARRLGHGERDRGWQGRVHDGDLQGRVRHQDGEAGRRERDDAAGADQDRPEEVVVPASFREVAAAHSATSRLHIASCPLARTFPTDRSSTQRPKAKGWRLSVLFRGKHLRETVRDEAGHAEQACDVAGGASRDRFARHAEHDARLLVLGNRLGALLPQVQQAVGAVLPHPGEQQRHDLDGLELAVSAAPCACGRAAWRCSCRCRGSRQ